MTDAEVDAYIKNNGGSGDTGSTYKYGSTGSTVTYIQTALTALDYYSAQITGHYGRQDGGCCPALSSGIIT